MENASKAMLIAGAILVAIMVVALGVNIFNKASSAADPSALDATEVSMFNSKFEGYEGQQLGTNVKTLLSKMISNAGANKGDEDKLPKVKLNSTGTEDNSINHIGEVKSQIVSTREYNVTFEYASNGLIVKIQING